MRIFRGITFAKCERFRPAEPVPLEDGMKDGGADYGTVMPQPSRHHPVSGVALDIPKMDEHRLCLTVYAPEDADNLPVMVWIHGGSFLVGGSEEHRYSCRRLVKTGHLVAVKISYRLGTLGYLWKPDEGIGNLGLDDQRKALQWIQDNISRFGGDPDNITLFGQSAGAYSIACLMAEGNQSFRRAILQSPPLGLCNPPDKATKLAGRFAERLKKECGHGIYDASIEEIIRVQGHFTRNKMRMPFMPVTDDNSPLNPCNAQTATSRHAQLDRASLHPANPLEVVIGQGADETAPFLSRPLGPISRTFIGKSLERHFTKKIFSAPIKSYTSSLREAGIETISYFINMQPPLSPLGSCHCIELPFILGEYSDWKKSAMLGGITEDEYDRLSSRYLKAWTDFANGRGFLLPKEFSNQ